MAEPLHFTYVCADRGVPIGGARGSSAHVAELTRALAARGAEVRILAARAADTDNGVASGVTVTDLRADRISRVLREALFAGVDRSRPQAHARAAETYGLCMNQVLLRELERLHRRWRIDAIYERYSLWSFAAASFARAEKIPYILEVNAPLREEQRRYRRLENPVAAATLESSLLRMASDVVVPSAELRPYLLRRGVQASRLRVIPNAADPERFPDRHVRNDSGEFVIGFLGSLKPWHGLENLVRAFRTLHRRFDGYRLLIAGDGPLRLTMEKSLRGDGLLHAAKFCGELTRDEVPEILAQMDVAVAPYPRLTGFYFSPLKLYEYMAAGVPIVASDIGQIGSVLAHRDTALLHRPGAVREMVESIQEIRRSPALATRLAKNARRILRRRFTWKRNAERVLRLVEGRRKRLRRAGTERER